MSTTTPETLDTMVWDIATRLYPHLDPDDGWTMLDPIYEWVEPLLAAGVAPDADALAAAWRFQVEAAETQD